MVCAMQRIRLAILVIVLAACQQGGGGGGAGEPTAAPSINLAAIQALTDCTKLQEMLDTWTADAILIVGSTVYVGRGDPNTSTCAPGSLTLCDFFQNHAGPFVLGHDWAALTPLARTHFEVHGKLADVYFECHYFDVATGVKTSDASIGLLGQPNTGQARKVRGKWLLSFAEAGAPPLSSGY